jgi:hypothetical protein
MATRPAAVHIDDLAAPRFPAEVAAIRSAMTAMGADLHLEPDALVAAAVEQTRLDDFGDSRFHEPLTVLCAALRTEAGLSPAGVTSFWVQLVALLKNRLLVEDVLKRHPEIHDLRIERPIIIAGLPRTGTTHLHNLMAADPSLRSLPYWESLEPVLAADERQRRDITCTRRSNSSPSTSPRCCSRPWRSCPHGATGTNPPTKRRRTVTSRRCSRCCSGSAAVSGGC